MTDLWITLGPSSIDIQEDLFTLGVTGVRLTFSFGTPELQLDRARQIKRIAAATGTEVTVVADLEGEKVRIGEFDGEPSIDVTAGDELRVVCADSADIVADRVLPVRNKAFVAELRAGARLVIGDGAAILQIAAAAADDVVAKVVTGGTINQTRGVTVQNSDIEPASLTDRDRANLEFIARHPEFDLAAVSFVSSAADVEDARAILRPHREMPVVAKIESRAGVANLAEICSAADMVMAARGDLALALPWPELPAAVNAIAETCERLRTPWVLATQIAEGLERFAFPTRAEICDLAHWLDRGCSAVMLSYETVFGSNAFNAVRSVQTMIARWG